MDDAIAPNILPRWYGSLDATLGMKAPLRFLGREDTSDMPFLTGEFLSAPLMADDGRIDMVLGAAHYSGSRSWEEVEAEAREALGLDQA
ncbi:MAG: hypothetical protein WDM89_21770 [Rhizomicrobium sp.]